MIKIIPVIIIVFLITSTEVFSFDQNDNPGAQYQYAIDTPAKKIIHIVPHSHQDAGWLRTADQYFQQQVNGILTNVVTYLYSNPEKTFTHAEIWFFKRWWDIQSEFMRSMFREVLQRGQFEFVNGGWVASDEACPTYKDLIENIFTGSLFLYKEFGISLNIVWHCDAFGHSMVTNEMFQEMGYDAFFFGRIDDIEHEQRKQARELEFMWQPEYEGVNGPERTEKPLFTHVMYNDYKPPCDIHVVGAKAHSKFDTTKELNKISQNTQKLIQCLHEYADSYKSQHVLMMYGDDFSWYYPSEPYKVMDQLIKTVNEHTDRFTFVYSTPKTYYEYVNNEIQTGLVSIPEFHYDFMPLQMQHKDSFWNGYFTSRPNFKKLIREYSVLSYTTSSLFAMDRLRTKSAIQEKEFQESEKLMEYLSLLMHHDTITGTSVRYVIESEVDEIIKYMVEDSQALSYLISRMGVYLGIQVQKMYLCLPTLNERYLCPKIQDFEDSQLIVVYNPSVHDYNFVQLVYTSSNLLIEKWDPITQNFEKVTAEAFCQEPPDYRFSKECDIFISDQIKSFQLGVYRITKDLNYDIKVKESEDNQEMINNEKIQLKILDFSENGDVTFHYNDIHDNIKTFTFDFRKYHHVSQNIKQKKAGVYVMKTQDNDSQSMNKHIQDIVTYHGQNVQQFIIHYCNNDNVHSMVTVRLYKKDLLNDQIEFKVFLAGIERDGSGIDVTVNWHCHDIHTDGLFYTDSNSLHMVKRENDYYQKHFHTQTSQKAASNYYPIDSAVMIEDKISGDQMVVMNDRSQGGSAYNNGRIELMINRRGFTCDELGNCESITEVDSHGKPINVDAKFYVQFTNDRDKAYEGMMRRFLRFMNEQQIFISDQFTVLENVDQESYLFNEAKRQNFISTLQNNDVEDIDLQFGDDIDIIYMTLTTSRKKRELNAFEIVKELCEYEAGLTNGMCDTNFSVERVYLNGVKQFDPLNDHSQTNIFQYLISLY